MCSIPYSSKYDFIVASVGVFEAHIVALLILNPS